MVKLLIAYGANLTPESPSWGFYKDKSMLESVPQKQPELKAFLNLAIACKDNNFSIIDDSVTNNDIQEFTNWKISITTNNSKFFPLHLRDLYNLKNFLATKTEFIEDNTVDKLDNTMNSYVQKIEDFKLELTGVTDDANVT